MRGLGLAWPSLSTAFDLPSSSSSSSFIMQDTPTLFLQMIFLWSLITPYYVQVMGWASDQISRALAGSRQNKGSDNKGKTARAGEPQNENVTTQPPVISEFGEISFFDSKLPKSSSLDWFSSCSR